MVNYRKKRKMKVLKIKTNNNKEYNVLVAINDKDKKKGLSDVKSMNSDAGMLFVWSKPIKPIMVMRDMNIDLDFVFLSNNNTILEVGTFGKDFKDKIIPKDNVSAIIELNVGNKDNFIVGEKIELLSSVSVKRENGILKFKNGGTGLTTSESEAMMIGSIKYDKILEKDIKIDKNAIQLLDVNGYVVANFRGGEIIFSRLDTKDIFRLSLEAKTQEQKEELGLIVLEMIDKQQSNESLYVKN